MKTSMLVSKTAMHAIILIACIALFSGCKTQSNEDSGSAENEGNAGQEEPNENSAGEQESSGDETDDSGEKTAESESDPKADSGKGKNPPPPTLGPGEAPTDMAALDGKLRARRTTSPQITIKNLNFGVEQALTRAQNNPGQPRFVGPAMDYLLTRTSFLNSYEDFDTASELIGTLVEKNPDNPDTWLLKAKLDHQLHRFDEAIKSLDKAQELGAGEDVVKARKAAISLTRGQPDAALELRRAPAEDAPSYGTHSDLGSALAAEGLFEDADRSYLLALHYHQDPSALAHSWIYFVRGLMWAERAGDSDKGAELYQVALNFLPDYVTANVHLAEIEAERGKLDEAIQRLEAIADKTSDPEPAGLLGELLLTTPDRKEEAQKWIDKAKARYDELLKKYPLAFSDHGAEFFMGPGNDAERALKLGLMNWQNRQTPRSLAIALAAANNAEDTAATCKLVEESKGMQVTGVELEELLPAAEALCPDKEEPNSDDESTGNGNGDKPDAEESGENPGD